MRPLLLILLPGWLLLLSSAMAAAQPALPAPTGLYPVGTTVWRPPSPVDGAYPAAAQLFYPAAAASGQGVPYLPDPGLQEALVESEYYRQSAEVLSAWGGIRIRAARDAPTAETRRARPFPLLLLSHGLGMSRTQYTAIALELASHGFVVATLDHAPGGFRVGADGALAQDSEPDLEQPDQIDALARRWADQSVRFIDVLLAADPGTTVGAVMATVDTLAIGAVGHSLGGTAAWTACRVSPRVRACAGLDGTLTPTFARDGFGKPTLILQSEPVYSDADLAAAGRTRAQWNAAGADTEWAQAVAAGDATTYRFGVRGFGHLSASDAPFVMPSTITYFGGRTVGAMRSHRIVSAYLRAFFDRTLRDYPAELLDGNPPFPEVERR